MCIFLRRTGRWGGAGGCEELCHAEFDNCDLVLLGGILALEDGGCDGLGSVWVVIHAEGLQVVGWYCDRGLLGAAYLGELCWDLIGTAESSSEA